MIFGNARGGVKTCRRSPGINHIPPTEKRRTGCGLIFTYITHTQGAPSDRSNGCSPH